MRPRGLRRSRPLLWSVVAAVAVLCAAGLYAYLRSPTRNLPYHDSFSGGNAGEWKAFGGTWETADDSMRNDSDERGAKLVTGSPYWRNYSIEADVSMLGSSGDAGLIIRTSDEEQGVDAYSGYYAGIRNIDNSLVLGRAGHGWIEDVLKLKPASAEMARWYHLKLLAYDCHVVAAMSNASGSGMATVSVTDKDCLRSGRAGLRSYGSGGIWRNVVIQSATAGDLNAMLERGKQTGSSMEPLPGRGREVHEFKVPLQMPEGYAFHSSQNTQSIASLRLLSSARATPAVVRGNVILTSPTLFIQDNTGGVSVPMPMSVPSLKLGDEVEASGLASPGDFSPVLEHATVRTLWDGTPIPPVTVTASQAAMGSFDATFIEVEGRLRSKQYGANNTLLLNFDVGSQAFRAVMNRGRGDYLFGKLKAGSLLRMRGVCVVDPAYTDNLTPFILLLRSTEDIDVLAGPPWWSAGHLAAMAIGFLLLALTANFIYHRIESWRLRAVLEERERLAHEMHDTLAQSFAGIGFQLEAIRNGVPEALPETHQQLNLASDLVRHSHEEARRSIATLRPETHGSADLLPALAVCAQRMVEGGTVEIVASSSGESTSIPLRITDTLYRIGQEAIANSIRHAHPTTLNIMLEFTSGSVRLTITDNGEGFVPGGDLRGFGVRGMRKRAASISAALEIESRPGQGTVVETTAPLPAKITARMLPKFFWLQLRKQTSHVPNAGKANLYSDRR